MRRPSRTKKRKPTRSLKEHVEWLFKMKLRVINAKWHKANRIHRKQQDAMTCHSKKQ